MGNKIKTGSRYASEQEIFTEDFMKINHELLKINKEFNLIDHTELNHDRFIWANKINEIPSFYASRYWEYPFSIIEANLSENMTCADIGCGTTPFTAYLATKVGSQNVYGFDKVYLKDDQNSHYAFGIRKKFIKKIGFNFIESDIDNIKYDDNSFDRVFCLSVLEHIDNPAVWKKGLQEMVRILKPGGKLIITFDINIHRPTILPVDILRYTGLNPVSNFNTAIPTKRFVKINDSFIDVFGIVLQKSNNTIELNNNEGTKIDEYLLQQKNVPTIYQENEIQIVKDLRRNYKIIRILLKLIFNKYK